jgi:sporulation protein YlmC with PRC-barrel domain
MQIKPGISVFTTDDQEAGRVERVVIDPRTQEMTHLVVGSSILFNDSRLIPMQMVDTADENKIQLLTDKDSLENLQYFEESHFIPPVQREDLDQDPGSFAPTIYWYPPVGMMGHPGSFVYPYASQSEQNLPDELVALKDGAQVIDISGENIGKVEKVITGDEMEKITHFVVDWGLLRRTRKLIPAHWIEGVGDDQVKLAVPRHEVENLPEYRE